MTEFNFAPSDEVKVSAAIFTINLLGKKEFTPTPDQYRRDRSIQTNGNILLSLVNDFRLPGIIYTLETQEVDRKNPMTQSKAKNWLSHSVGIVKVDHLYLAFDQTSNQDNNGSSEHFFCFGSLEDISVILDERFGPYWNIDFKPEDGRSSNLSVEGKIETVRQLLAEANKSSFRFSLSDITPETHDNQNCLLNTDRNDIYLPLGLKYVYTGIKIPEALGQKLRTKSTFPYA